MQQANVSKGNVQAEPGSACVQTAGEIAVGARACNKSCRLMMQRKRARGVGGVTGRSSTTKSSAKRAHIASSAGSRAGVQGAIDGIYGGTRIRPRSSRGIRLLELSS